MFRILLGSILGAVAGGLVWVFAELTTGRELIFLVLLIGLCAGIGGRWLGRLNKHSYVAGALAALVTLGAIVGAKYALAEAWMRKVEAQTNELQITQSDVADDEPEESESETGVVVPLEDSQILPAGTGSVNVLRNDPSAFSPWDLALYCCSALMAYVIGSGRDSPADRAAVEPPRATGPDPEPPADNADN